MSFILQNKIFEKIDHIWVDGEEIADCETPFTNIEISADAKDTIDENGCIIKRFFATSFFVIIGDKDCVIRVDDTGEGHLLCVNGWGWINRPNKKKRIAKKWAKKYGKRYGYCSANMNIRGTVETYTK